MIRYRPFLNSDSPGLVEVWRSQTPLHGRLDNPTPATLEQHVFSKPYFDPAGLIVAIDGDRIIGFVHAGFSPADQAGKLDRHTGLICLLMVQPQADAGAIAAELLNVGESYLRREGAVELFGGEVGLCSPFYLGLYGGSNLPGVLSGDTTMIDALRQAGYAEHRRQIVMQRGLAEFHPPVDRQLMQLRRQFKLALAAEPNPTRWQDACVWGLIDRTKFSVLPLVGDQPIATLTFWDVEPLSHSWGVRTVGLLDVYFQAGSPREDVLVCFLGESLRHFQAHGIGSAEVQALSTDAHLLATGKRLGFQQVDQGIQFRKS